MVQYSATQYNTVRCKTIQTIQYITIPKSTGIEPPQFDYIAELLIVSDFINFSEKSGFQKRVDLLYKSLTNLIISGGL